jgi:hypothetical protein
LNENQLNGLVEQIKDMADLAEEMLLLHDIKMDNIMYHRGQLQAYEDVLKMIQDARVRGGPRIEV